MTRQSIHDRVTDPQTQRTQTVEEWAEELGVGVCTMLHRLRGGISEKTFRVHSNTGRPLGATSKYCKKDAPKITDPVTQRSMTLAEWAVELGITKHSLLRRIRKMGIVANVFLSSKDMRSKRCGKKTLQYYTDPLTSRSQTARQWAEELGYESAQQFRQRINRYRDRPDEVYKCYEGPKSSPGRQRVNLVVVHKREHYEVIDPESRKVLLDLIPSGGGFQVRNTPSLWGKSVHQVVVAALEA
jgi:hypothetical protein